MDGTKTTTLPRSQVLSVTNAYRTWRGTTRVCRLKTGNDGASGRPVRVRFRTCRERKKSRRPKGVARSLTTDIRNYSLVWRNHLGLRNTWGSAGQNCRKSDIEADRGRHKAENCSCQLELYPVLIARGKKGNKSRQQENKQRKYGCGGAGRNPYLIPEGNEKKRNYRIGEDFTRKMRKKRRPSSEERTALLQGD